MSFEHLEKQVADFFRRNTQAVSADFLVKQKTRHFVLKSFEESHKIKTPWWLLWRKLAQIGMAFGLMLFGAVVHRLVPESYAGEIHNTSGLVEVIRDDQVLTVVDKKSFRLKVGDLVQVDDRSRATINTKNGIKTQLKGVTKLRVAAQNNLFIQEGNIQALLPSGNMISTHRGFISASDEGTFSMEILPTGEAHVVLEDKAIEVSDWLDNKAQLSVVGSELRLKTDTQLSEKKIPRDLKLSDTQLQMIESKLVIARSKLFTGLEKSLIKRNSGRSDITSAQKTFRSILHIIQNTDRQLVPYGSFDLESVDNTTVLEAIIKRTGDQNLTTEAQAFMALLQIVEHRSIDYKADTSNETTFNRYGLTYYLQALANDEGKILLEHVKNQYVSTSLRKIINHEKRSKQVQELEQLVLNIPTKHPLRTNFLAALNTQLDPILQDFLAEFTSKRL